MNLSQTSMKRAVLVLLAAAVVTSAAQAAQPSGRASTSTGDRPVAGYSPQELMGISTSHPQVSTSHVRELMARATNSVPSAIVSSVTVQKPVSPRSGGFDWGDAGIGATSGFALALVVAGSLLFLLRRRPRGQDGSTPQTA